MLPLSFLLLHLLLFVSVISLSPTTLFVSVVFCCFCGSSLFLLLASAFTVLLCTLWVMLDCSLTWLPPFFGSSYSYTIIYTLPTRDKNQMIESVYNFLASSFTSFIRDLSRYDSILFLFSSSSGPSFGWLRMQAI